MSVGRVLGTPGRDALHFWVAIEPGESLELDDAGVVHTELPDGRTVTLHGVVDLVNRSRVRPIVRGSESGRS